MADFVDPRRVERAVIRLAEWAEKNMPEEDRKRFEEDRERAEATGESRKVSAEEVSKVLSKLADAFCKAEKESESKMRLSCG